MMNRWIVLLVLALCPFRLFAGSSLSIDELQRFMDQHYPRTIPGKVEVTFLQPRVMMLGEDRVKFIFSILARTANGSSRYEGVLASFDGELVRSKELLFVDDMSNLRLDAEGVDYTYRGTVENIVTRTIIDDYVAHPILQLMDEESTPAWKYAFGAKPITITR